MHKCDRLSHWFHDETFQTRGIIIEVNSLPLLQIRVFFDMFVSALQARIIWKAMAMAFVI